MIDNLGHMVVLFSFFSRNLLLIFTEEASVVKRIPHSPCPCQYLSFVLLVLTITVSVRLNFNVVLTCIFLITKNVEHFLECLFVIYSSAVELTTKPIDQVIDWDISTFPVVQRGGCLNFTVLYIL